MDVVLVEMLSELEALGMSSLLLSVPKVKTTIWVLCRPQSIPYGSYLLNLLNQTKNQFCAGFLEDVQW